MFSVEQLVANRIWFDLRSRVFFCKPTHPFGYRKVPLRNAFAWSGDLIVSRWKVRRGRSISVQEASRAIGLLPFVSFFHKRGAWPSLQPLKAADTRFLEAFFPYVDTSKVVREDYLLIQQWDGWPISVTWQQIAALSRWYVGTPMRPSEGYRPSLENATRSYLDVLCTARRLRETESWGETLE